MGYRYKIAFTITERFMGYKRMRANSLEVCTRIPGDDIALAKGREQLRQLYGRSVKIHALDVIDCKERPQ